MRPILWASLILPSLLAAAPALACEEYPGQPVPTITGTETNLEPCEPRPLFAPAFIPRVVVVRPVVDIEGAAQVTGSIAGAVQPEPRRPGCRVQQYDFDEAVVRVHRC